MPGGLQHARDLVRLTRPANALVAGASVYVGALLATPAAGAPLAWAPSGAILAGMVAAFAFAAAGNVRNDAGDIAVDRIAHPERPLARGSVSLAEARTLAIGLYLLSLAAAVLVSTTGFALVLGAIPIMEGYERWGKARGLPGNLLVALLTMAPFILGGIAAGAGGGSGVNVAVLSVALLAALVTAGREVLKDVEDVDADRGMRQTLPLRIGARRAAFVAAAFLVLAVLLSPLPFFAENVLGGAYLGAIGAADACFLAAAAIGPRTPSRGQRLAKLGMVLALVALVVGRIQVG